MSKKWMLDIRLRCLVSPMQALIPLLKIHQWANRMLQAPYSMHLFTFSYQGLDHNHVRPKGDSVKSCA